MFDGLQIKRFRKPGADVEDFIEELRDYLATVQDVSAVCGQRIHLDELRQRQKLPQLVLVEATGGEVVIDLSGNLSGVSTTFLHVYCYANSRDDANRLDKAVLSALCGTDGLGGRGQIASTFVNSIVPLSTRFWERDNSRDGGQSSRRICRRPYAITHAQATT